MKKFLRNIFYLASIAIVLWVTYRLHSLGMGEAVRIEFTRYSGISVNYIYILGILILSSFPTGWLLTKLKAAD